MLFDPRSHSSAALGGVARRGIYSKNSAVDLVKRGKTRFAAMCAH